MKIHPIEKWKTMPAAAKSAIAFAVSSLLLRGISFITTPIFTRLMDTTQYGIVTTYNAWNTVLEIFALLGLTSAGVFNTGLNDYKDSRDRFISTVLFLCNITTLFVFAVIMGLKAVFGSDFILPTKFLSVMFAQYIFYPAQIFWITRERYEFRYKTATVVSVASSLVSQLIAVVCVLHASPNDAAFSKIIGTAIGSLLFYIPIYFLLYKLGHCLVDRSIWKQVLAFALPLIPHYLAQHVMSSADRIMIASMHSQSAAAIYGVVSAIGMIATVVWSAINASLTPYIYEKLNIKAYKDINKVVVSLLLGYAVICCGVALIAPEVLKILAPEEYYSGVYAVPPIVGVSFLNALYNVYAVIEFYHKQSTGITTATIISCAINILLNALLIPKYGFVAAAYTTLVSNMVLVLMHYRFYRKCQPERVYNDKLIFGLTVVCLLLCEVCNVLYMSTALRYVVVLILLFIIIWKRDYILKQIKALQKK